MHVAVCAFILGMMMTVSSAMGQEKTWAIAIHGGASNIARDLSEEKQAVYKQGLTEALAVGQKILADGGTSLDAVEATVRVLEDNPLFNAGRGAVFNVDGFHQLDACIMDGSTLACGSLACVTRVKNPITAARRLMETVDHNFLAGEGADEFAIQQGCEDVPNSYFYSKSRFQALQAFQKQNDLPVLTSPSYGFPDKTVSMNSPSYEAMAEVGNTVGCVALDVHGNLASATSTGGRTGKRVGRVGDSPIVGGGTLADRQVAVSCTGTGEEFIRHRVAGTISFRVEYLHETLERAAGYCINGVLKKGDGGLISVDKTGSISVPYNTGSMSRGVADSSGRFEVSIWEQPLP
ncbi:isoaspartyl peptidase/L-asparaginase family protein [Lacunimicrobium album]